MNTQFILLTFLSVFACACGKGSPSSGSTGGSYSDEVDHARVVALRKNELTLSRRAVDRTQWVRTGNHGGLDAFGRPFADTPWMSLRIEQVTTTFTAESTELKLNLTAAVAGATSPFASDVSLTYSESEMRMSETTLNVPVENGSSFRFHIRCVSSYRNHPVPIKYYGPEMLRTHRALVDEMDGLVPAERRNFNCPFVWVSVTRISSRNSDRTAETILLTWDPIDRIFRLNNERHSLRSE